LDPGATVSALLAHPTMVLADLGVLSVQLVTVKIMPVADAAVAPQVLRGSICFGFPAGLFL